jgi:hypothetical protein
MADPARTVEQKVAFIAARTHGVVTRTALLRAGMTRHEINGRLGKGSLLREYKGVYRVGHRAPSIEARYLAAVRACGEGAVLSGRAAGHLLGLLKGAAPPPEVTTRIERRIKGIKSRRSRQIDPADMTSFKAIPVTTVPRTLVDLAATLDPENLARACHEAGVRHRTTPAQVESVLARRPTARGAAKLRNVLRGDTQVTLSKLERRFLEILRENGLELPQTNKAAGGRRVDCRWPQRHLTVELDSYRYHGSRHTWELDRRREREAHAREDDLRRYTYGDVFDDPRAMMSELRGLLKEKP